MAFFRKLSLTVLSSLLIIFLSLSAIGLSLKILLYPEVYENALDRSGAYGFLEEFESKGGTGPLQLVSDVPAKEVGQEATVKLFAYLRGDIEKEDVTIKLNTSKLMEFYEEKASNFTVCKEGEQPYIRDEVICRPPKISSSEFLNEVLKKKNVTISDEANLLDSFDKEGKISEIRRSVEIFNTAIYYCLSASLLIVLLIVLIEREDLKLMEAWVGADFLLSGIILFVLVFAGFFGLSYVPIQNQTVYKILELVATPVLQRIGFIAFIVFLFACALLILSFISKKNSNNQV